MVAPARLVRAWEVCDGDAWTEPEEVGLGRACSAGLPDAWELPVRRRSAGRGK